jgi:hypothetical protein
MLWCKRNGWDWRPFMPDVILATGDLPDRGRVKAWYRAYKKLGLVGEVAQRGRPFLWVKNWWDLLARSPGHIGDTAEVRDDEYRTIEGNSRSKVDRRWRSTRTRKTFFIEFDRIPDAMFVRYAA